MARYIELIILFDLKLFPLFLDLYYYFRKIHEENREDQCILNCYLLIIKYGPLYGLPIYVLRNDYGYITKLCQIVSSQSSKLFQEDVLDIAITFCKHVSIITSSHISRRARH